MGGYLILSGPLIKSHVCDGARGLTARVWTPRAAVMAAVPQRAPPYICQIQISRVSRAHAPITADKENWNKCWSQREYILLRTKHLNSAVHTLTPRHMGNPAEKDGATQIQQRDDEDLRLCRVTLSDRDALHSRRERGVSFSNGPSARTPGSGSEEAVRRGPRRLGDRLLREEARRGDHAQACVRQLLLL